MDTCVCMAESLRCSPETTTPLISYPQIVVVVNPRTVAHEAPLSMGFPRPRILEWVAVSFSRGSSRPTDQTRVSCIGRRTLYH